MGQPQIIIIGAGIAGLSLAWQLVKNGEAVTIIDEGAIGSGASRAATAYLEPRLGTGGLREIEWASVREWPCLAAEIENATGHDVDYRRDGLLHVVTPERADRLIEEFRERQIQGWNVRLPETEEVKRLEPNLSGETGKTLHLPDVHWLDGRRLCQALADGIRKTGGVLIEHQRVMSLERSGELFHVDTGEQVLLAGKIVICTGAAGANIGGFPDDVPVCRPVRGIIVSVRSDAETPIVNRIIKHEEGIICPRSDGRMLLGTTYERGETSLNVSEELASRIIENAARFVPRLRDCTITESTAGIRALAPDGLVHLGQSRETPGVYYSLSHGGAGYLRAPVIARELAEFIMDDSADCPLTGKYLAR